MPNSHHENTIEKIYSPEYFRSFGMRVINIMSEYLNSIKQNNVKEVLPNITPDSMLSKWLNDFSEQKLDFPEDFINDILSFSNHLHNPKYLGHQVTAPLPISAILETVSTLLNNASAIYEMGPVSTIMEKKVIEWMINKIGFNKEADGYFTSGGTIGNLTCLLAARQNKAGYDIWKEGVNENSNLSILVSDQTHYSIKRAAGIMGLGTNAVISIPTDNNFRINVDELKKIYRQTENKGKKVFAVVANACTTSTGTFDPIDKIADFCEERNLWLHIDGAHGASSLLSQKYRYLMKDSNRADSIIWDMHKMMLIPALATAVIFKNKKHSYEVFAQQADYLFDKPAEDEWYNLSQRTMECTKTMMGFKVYSPLYLYGERFFSDYIEKMYDLTKQFANIIKKSDDFEIATEPDCNIICFRYVKAADEEILNDLQKKIRKKILEREKFYIVQTTLNKKNYLRCTIINPLTSFNDLEELLFEIREIVNEE